MNNMGHYQAQMTSQEQAAHSVMVDKNGFVRHKLLSIIGLDEWPA